MSSSEALPPHLERIFKDLLATTEQIYDRVIRRWGNVYFAQSSVYDWVWSEDFDYATLQLDSKTQGQLRMLVMRHFRIRPWPWFSGPSQHMGSQHEY